MFKQLFLFEIKDGKGQTKNWGRWGILTNEYFGEPQEKPRYNAVEFLNNFDWKYYQVTGMGTWVKAIATKEAGGNAIRMLVVNYDPYMIHSEKVPITFTNLSLRNFKFRRTDFNGTVRENSVSVTSSEWRVEEDFQPNSAAMFEILPQ